MKTIFVTIMCPIASEKICFFGDLKLWTIARLFRSRHKPPRTKVHRLLARIPLKRTIT